MHFRLQDWSRARAFLFGAAACCALTTHVTAQVADLNSPTVVRPPVSLSLKSAQVVSVGQFPPDTRTQDVTFEKPVKGRYFCLETLSAQDGRPYAAVAELNLLNSEGGLLDRAGWRIVYVDSEERDREDGSAEKSIDGYDDTFWHTQWSQASPGHPHHLVIKLLRSETIAGFRYTGRPGNGLEGGYIKDYRVYVGDDLVDENAGPVAIPATCRLFSYFTGVGKEGLSLAYSLNGYRWDQVGHGHIFLRPEVGADRLMRDPCLARGLDGIFRMVWTDSWTGNSIGYSSSKDLMHWTKQQAIPVMADESGAQNCWAPELCWDARQEQFLIFWSSTVKGKFPETAGAAADRSNNRIYCTTTRDFETFSPTRVLFDPGFPIIDATILPSKGRYYLIFKDDRLTPRRQNVSAAVADKPDGPYELIEPSITTDGVAVEGPTAFRSGDQTIVCYHRISENTFGAMKSADFKHWEDISSGMALPSKGKQGTVLEVPGEALRPLIESGWMSLGRTPEASELCLGDWIWADSVVDKQTCRLWHTFDLPKGDQVVHAELRMTAADNYTVYLDGREVGRGSDVTCVTTYDITWLLPPGRHVLAVEAFNDTMDAGVILGLNVKLGSGKTIEVLSDESWRVVGSDFRGWQKSKQAHSDWFPARTVGYGGRAWWQYPARTAQAAPLQPPATHFWQETWFLVGLIAMCVIVASFSVRQGLQLAVQTRSHRLLDRERTRIARDIHDDIGAGLTQLTLMGELALRETEQHEEIHKQVDSLCVRARHILGSLDEVVWSVNPKRDTVHDFATFAVEYAQNFMGDTPIRCRFDVADNLPDIPLDLPARRNLLLAMKEALRNAVRHSAANEVVLHISVQDQNLEVVVEDNGKGFDSRQAKGGRNGLANMQQRLVDIGGICTVVSKPAAGTRLIFSLPLKPKLPKSLLFSPRRWFALIEKLEKSEA